MCIGRSARFDIPIEDGPEIVQSKTRVRQRERSDTPPTFFYIDGEDETGLPRLNDFVVGSENRTAAVACELFL
ncbi:MAG: hypothetical protein D6741_15505, partial [Planctomycetota bacterium]